MFDEELNVTDEPESGYIEYSDRPETYIVPVLFGIIFLVGVTGNGCLVYILCRHKAMRSVPNTFIFNLAVGDLLVLLFTVPFTSTIYTFDSWPYGEFVCRASEFVKDTSVGVSVFTLTALSLDRYTAIVRPVQSFVGGPRSKQVTVSLAVIWTVSLGLAMPAALFSHLLVLRIPPPPGPVNNETAETANGTASALPYREIFVCYPFPEEFGPNYPKFVIMMRALLHYIVPLITIGTFYAIMAHHLLRSVQTIPGQATLSSPASVRHRGAHHRHESSPKADAAQLQQHQQQQQQQQLQQQQHQPSQNRTRRKVAKMVLSFVVLFAVCFLPMHVFFLWFHFDPDAREKYDIYWHTLKIIGFVLAYINSCINPIALYCVSTSFRKHFNRLLCCGSRCCCDSPSASGSASSGWRRRRGDDAGDEPLSTAVSQYNNRTTLGTATKSFRTSSTTAPGPNGANGRRHAPVEEELPLSEFVRM